MNKNDSEKEIKRLREEIEDIHFEISKYCECKDKICVCDLNKQQINLTKALNELLIKVKKKEV